MAQVLPVLHENLRESRTGRCCETSGVILLLLFPHDVKIEAAQNFSQLENA